MDVKQWRVVPCDPNSKIVAALINSVRYTSNTWQKSLALATKAAPTTDAPVLIDPAELAALRERIKELEAHISRSAKQ